MIYGIQIKRKDVDLARKHKQLARGSIGSYPPRIVLTIQCERNMPGVDVPWLKCSFQVSGIEEDISFPLYLSPSPSLSQRSSSMDSSEGMLYPDVL